MLGACVGDALGATLGASVEGDWKRVMDWRSVCVLWASLRSMSGQRNGG